jgi:hypothetical protein
MLPTSNAHTRIHIRHAALALGPALALVRPEMNARAQAGDNIDGTLTGTTSDGAGAGSTAKQERLGDLKNGQC